MDNNYDDFWNKWYPQDNIYRMDYEKMWQNEKYAEKDMGYLKELYPKEARILNECVLEELDNYDYKGSFIYDEYPDKFMFYRICDRITEKYLKDIEQMNKYSAEKYNDGMEKNNNVDDKYSNKKEWITKMCQIIMVHEMYKMRNKQKRSIYLF